jgi:hypothetical protein
MAKGMELKAAGAAFAELVVAYDALLGQCASMDVREFLTRVQLALARLQVGALELPDPDADFEEDDAPTENGRGDFASWSERQKSLEARFGRFDAYSKIFDAFDGVDREPVVGLLSDDLADILRDLQEGLEAWKRGAHAQALWSWRFMYGAHWGQHAASALHALHVLRFMHQFEPPRPGSR